MMADSREIGKLKMQPERTSSPVGFRMTVLLLATALWLLPVAAATPVAAQPRATEGDHPDIRLFFLALDQDRDKAAEALDQIAEQWRDGYAGMLWDLIRFYPPPRDPAPAFSTDPTDPTNQTRELEPPPVESPGTRVWRDLMGFLEDQTGQRFRGSLVRAHQWIWAQPYDPHPDYPFFKGVWYREIDPAFADFFPPGTETLIRLDEIDWGGVPVNGIPPLEYSEYVGANDDAADYLDDDDIVFGIAAGGEMRAYPKRILAWHEMALDQVGGIELTIVYCTLCGTVIPYESVVDGRHIKFGTSGLLYRSNKLMFDHGTKSLWNTFEGVPVVGALVGSGLRLTHRAVVTTTWGEWRRMHPGTTVLTLATGHERDYGEGVAYRDYFSTDALMFPVPDLDDHPDGELDNKDEVLTLLLEDAAGQRQPLAISTEFLEDNRLHPEQHAGRRLLVVTTGEGANRVFDPGDSNFVRLEGDLVVVDADGGRWQVTEDALVHADNPSRRLPRVAAQRAFWFGWRAQFPETRLVRD
ncbi:MAG: DUF3179 domain-containing protein [Acidobacteria bacterium]|nr:DUF3179 domain-containing protein [Acidobacteriota bacterium]MYD72297.1 DUF3179 domain-containing protein [Acidobacteriota bacterium]MYJ04194.1 DUF3179 domain-containing protein [Acidobacteriota bacterium]